MNRLRFVPVAVTCLLAAALAACGGSGGGSEAVAGGACERSENFEIAVPVGVDTAHLARVWAVVRAC